MTSTSGFPFIGEFSALFTALLWAGSSFLFAAAAVRVGSVTVNVTRLFFAAILLFLTVMICGLDLTLSRSQYINLIISGAIGLAFGDTFLFKAYQHIGARLSMVVMSLAPAVALVCAYFFLGEHISLFGIIGIVITLSGITIVAIERPEKSKTHRRMTSKGLFFGICGACGQAGGLLFAKQAFLEGPINGFVAAFIRIMVSVVLLIPFAFLSRNLKHPVQLFIREPQAFKNIGYGTLFGPYLGITLSLFAVAHTEVGIAATLLATTPIMMLPMSRILQKEYFSWKAILGAFITVGGVALLFLH